MIDVENLKIRISGETIVNGLSFQVSQGEKVFIKGKVGSGKTILFKALSGLIPVFYKAEVEGGIRICGERNPESFRKHVHLVGQIPEEQIVFEDVRDEISYNKNGDEIVNEIVEHAKKLGIENLLDRKTSQLSDGEKQLVVILSSFISNKECLIFDETFSHLHPSRVKKIYDFILKSEKTVLFADKKFEGFNSKTLDFGSDLTNSADSKSSVTDFSLTELKFPGEKEIIIAEGINFSYENGAEILRGVDFVLNEGEIALITGDNGSGKTTFLKILAGILKAGGQVRIYDEPKISLQYPNYSFTKSTVGEEFEGVELCAKFFAGKLSRHPHTLSAGEAKLLSVLKALSSKLVLLDEPTVYQNADFVLELIGLLRREKKSVVIASHDERLEAYADSIYELKDGKLRRRKK